MNDNFKTIVEHMSESVWIWDKDEKTIYANPNFCNLVWYTLEEMIWRESYDFWDEESKKTVKEVNERERKLWETWWKPSTYEWNLLTKDGEKIPVFLSWAPLPDWWSVWIMTDLREIETLKQINKIKDEFLNTATHELRTPLTSVKWYLSMIIDWDLWVIDNEAKTYLNKVYNTTGRLIDLIWELLDLKKLESWEDTFYMEAINIKDLITETHDELKVLANKKEQKLTVDVEYDKLIFSTDPSKLKLVLTNLLSNAIKYTQSWWKIKIKSFIKNNKLTISFIDNWFWLKEEDLDVLFDDFTRIKTEQTRDIEWTWLWLPIVKKIIDRLWGKIEVKSKEGKWSEFTIKFKL